MEWNWSFGQGLAHRMGVIAAGELPMCPYLEAPWYPVILIPGLAAQCNHKSRDYGEAEKTD